jgi:hypothetical protein
MATNKEKYSAEKLNNALNGLLLLSPTQIAAIAEKKENADAAKMHRQLDALLLPSLKEIQALTTKAEENSAQKLNQGINNLLNGAEASKRAQIITANNFDAQRPQWVNTTGNPTRQQSSMFQAVADNNKEAESQASITPTA